MHKLGKFQYLYLQKNYFTVCHFNTQMHILYLYFATFLKASLGKKYFSQLFFLQAQIG